MSDLPDPDALLAELGFDDDDTVLTRRQAQVLALRERGAAQRAIAEELGTSRANVSSVESSARENVRRAGETIAFAETLRAPVRVTVPAGTDLYDVPNRVFTACDEADLPVKHTAPELLQLVADVAGDAVREREVRRELVVGVTAEGRVRVRST